MKKKEWKKRARAHEARVASLEKILLEVTGILQTNASSAKKLERIAEECGVPLTRKEPT